MAVDERALAASITALTSTLPELGGPPVTAASARLAEVVAAAADLLDVDSVGVLLLDVDGVLRAAASTSPVATELEELQQRVGLGPGHDTIARRGTVAVEELTAVPCYAPLVAELEAARPRGPARAVLSVPIWVADDVVGNLNLIRTGTHRWSESESRAAATYAEVVGRLLGDSAAARATQARARAYRTEPRAGIDPGGGEHAS